MDNGKKHPGTGQRETQTIYMRNDLEPKTTIRQVRREGWTNVPIYELPFKLKQEGTRQQHSDGAASCLIQSECPGQVRQTTVGDVKLASFIVYRTGQCQLD